MIYFILYHSAKDVESLPRRAAFSNWETLYDHDNRVTEEKKNSCSYRPSSIDDHFKKRYHKYRRKFYWDIYQYTGDFDENTTYEFAKTLR